MKLYHSVIATLIVLVVLFGGYCVEYTVEWWGAYLKGQPVDVPYWLCVIAAIPLSALAIPAAVITLLLSCVL